MEKETSTKGVDIIKSTHHVLSYFANREKHKSLTQITIVLVFT